MNDPLPQWTCPHCLEVFPSRDSMKEHLKPDMRLILDLLDRRREALTVPSCQQHEDTSDSLDEENEENEENDGETNPMKPPLAKEDLRCPYLNCGRAYSRKNHLTRHFKNHINCNVNCECGLKFIDVDQFDKHLVSCQIIKAGSGSKERRQVLGLQKELHSTTKERLNKLLKSKSQQERGQSSKRVEFFSSSGTQTISPKQNRASSSGRQSSRGIKRHRSDQGELEAEDAISPRSCCDAIQQRPFNGLDSDAALLMANNPEGAQASINPESRFCAQESIDDISPAEEAASVQALNTIAWSSPPEGCTEQSPLITTGITYPQAANTGFQEPTFAPTEMDFDISTLMEPAHTFGDLDISMLLQPAWAFEELDISMLMQPARPFGELDISMQMQHAPIFADTMYPKQTFGSLKLPMSIQQRTQHGGDLDIAMIMQPVGRFTMRSGSSVSMEPPANGTTT